METTRRQEPVRYLLMLERKHVEPELMFDPDFRRELDDERRKWLARIEGDKVS